MKWYIKVLRQYADFSGRARPKEFWMFFLFNILVTIALTAVLFLISLVLERMHISPGYDHLEVIYSGVAIYGAAMLIPHLAVLVRRLHDTNRSAWWILIGLVPVLGGIWLLFLLILPGDTDANRYGDNNSADIESFTLPRRQKSVSNALILGAVLSLIGLVANRLFFYGFLAWSLIYIYSNIVLLPVILATLVFGILFRKNTIRSRSISIMFYVVTAFILISYITHIISTINYLVEVEVLISILITLAIPVFLLGMCISAGSKKSATVALWAKLFIIATCLEIVWTALFFPFYHSGSGWEFIASHYAYALIFLRYIVWVVFAASLPRLHAAEIEAEENREKK